MSWPAPGPGTSLTTRATAATAEATAATAEASAATAEASASGGLGVVQEAVAACYRCRFGP